MERRVVLCTRSIFDLHSPISLKIRDPRCSAMRCGAVRCRSIRGQFFWGFPFDYSACISREGWNWVLAGRKRRMEQGSLDTTEDINRRQETGKRCEEKKSMDRLPHVCGDCKHWDQFKLRCRQSREVHERTLRRARVRKGNRKVCSARTVHKVSKESNFDPLLIFRLCYFARLTFRFS